MASPFLLTNPSGEVNWKRAPDPDGRPEEPSVLSDEFVPLPD